MTLNGMSQHGGNTREWAEKLGISESVILDFSANINPLGMPELLKQAIREHSELGQIYPDPHYHALHQSIADFHQCQSWQVLAGNGATELIFLIISLLKPQKTLLLIPSFAEYHRALEQNNSQIIEYQLDEGNNFAVDEKLLNAITEEIDCLFLCNPNNPTGQLIQPDLLQQIVLRCQQCQVSLIIDEAFIDFAGEQYSLIPSLLNHPHVFVLRSLTKFFAIPGLRLGYIVNGNQHIMQQLRSQQQPWTINCFAELAGKTILTDHQYIAATHQWLQQEQTYLYQELSKIPLLKVYPPSANYIFFRCLIPEFDLQEYLLKEHHILIRDCGNYCGLRNGFYRIGVKNRENNKRLINAALKYFQYSNR